MSRRPKMLVFDLDYTLWPFWVCSQVKPPFEKTDSGEVKDALGHKILPFPEVSALLKELKDDGYTLGVASRTSEIAGAYQLIKLLGWEEYFTYIQIFPGRKITHFDNIQRESGVDFKDMIFFDDENRNITDLTSHGVFSVYVRRGVSKQVLGDALEKYAQESFGRCIGETCPLTKIQRKKLPK